MKRAAIVLVAITALLAVFNLSSPVWAANGFPNDDEVEGPWTKLPEFDAEIDDASFYDRQMDFEDRFRRNVAHLVQKI